MSLTYREHVQVGAISEAIRTSPRRSELATRVIAIDGCGGAGKSSLAEALGSVLSAPVIATDDFASWKSPLGWAPRFVAEVLEPLARGEPICYRRYDWTARRLSERVQVPPSPMLIIEGVGSNRLDFVAYIDFSIWVETERLERFRRGIERDGEAMAAQWSEWMAAEDTYVLREEPNKRADLVVSGENE